MQRQAHGRLMRFDADQILSALVGLVSDYRQESGFGKPRDPVVDGRQTGHVMLRAKIPPVAQRGGRNSATTTTRPPTNQRMRSI